MKHHIIHLQIWQMVAAYLFIVFLLAVVKWRKIPRLKEISISTIRMTGQLIIVGFLLIYLFKHPNPWLTVLVILIMEAFAVYNVYKQVKTPLSNQLKKVVAFSLVTGTIISLIFFNFVVIRFSPWFNPRYFIPIAGMLIGNAMTGVTLGVNSLVNDMDKLRHKVEVALMLGATTREASKEFVDEAFAAAVLPTINKMVGMGIVFLPGMMTGVILSGTSPLVAVEYQIAIMLGIAGSVSLSVILFVQLGYQSFFNSRSQLQ